MDGPKHIVCITGARGSVIGCGSDSDDDATVIGSEAAEEGGEAAAEGRRRGSSRGRRRSSSRGRRRGSSRGRRRAAAEEGGEAAEEEGGEAVEEEGGEEAPEPTCPELDLSGYYDLNFAVSAKPEPTTVWVDVTMTDDENCYTGEVIAPSDDSKLADLASIVQVGDNLELTFQDFVIPPGQTDLLRMEGSRMYS